jgi:hypothetical protein
MRFLLDGLTEILNSRIPDELFMLGICARRTQISSIESWSTIRNRFITFLKTPLYAKRLGWCAINVKKNTILPAR